MKHAELLFRLLPPGAYDLTEPNLAAELEAEGAALDAALESSNRLLNEIDPATAYSTLGDWERVYGISQQAVDLGLSLEQRQAAVAATSREIYKWMQITPEETLTDIQRAARFFYLQKQSFGGKVDGQTFGTATTSPPRLNLLRLEEDLSQAHLRLSQTYIEHLNWEACIKKYDRDHTLFYCDPPYWGTEGYGVDFGIEQYTRMAALARTIKGKMVISVNDIPEMREAFAGLNMESVGITYSVGGAGRSGKTAELVIRNW